MIGVIRLAWTVFATGALGWVVWFAHKAGQNSASVSASRSEKVEADIQTDTLNRMAEAAGQEMTDKTVLQRMRNGTA